MYGRLRRGRDGGAQGAHLRGAEKTRLSGDLRSVQQYDLRFLQQRALGQSGSDLGFEKNDADFFDIYAEYAIK